MNGAPAVLSAVIIVALQEQRVTLLAETSLKKEPKVLLIPSAIYAIYTFICI